jgi:predicted branched-subunit amino acid permease
MCIGVLVGIILGQLSYISFVFKYCIVFFIFFMALLDSKKQHYYVLGENKKIIANIIIEDEQ